MASQAFAPITSFLSHASPASFTLFGRNVSPAGWGFTASTVASPGPELTVAAGEAVTVSLNSADGGLHNWGVDYNRNGVNDVGEPESTTFTGTTSFTFTATSTQGTYTYWCFIHKGPMFGNFIVQPPTPDFSIDANPTTLGPLAPGEQGTSTIIINSLNGFTSDVTLTIAPSTGLTTTISPSAISGGSGTSALAVSAASAGTYTVNVTGTSGTLTHSVIVAVDVVAPDFTITASRTLTLSQGASTTFNVNLQSLNGFAGDVSLTAIVNPSGPIVSINPTKATLSQGRSETSVVTVSAAGGLYSSVQAGAYTLKIIGAGGSSSHSVDVALTVTSQDSAGVGNFPVNYIAGAAIVVAGAIVVTAFIVRRGRAKK